MKTKTLTLLALIFCSRLVAQTSITTLETSGLRNIAASVDRSIARYQDRMIRGAERMLRKLHKNKNELDFGKDFAGLSLPGKGSVSEFLFARNENVFDETKSETLEYIPWLDSLETAFKFLALGQPEIFSDTYHKIVALHRVTDKLDRLNSFICKRRDQVRKEFNKLGFIRKTTGISRQVVFFRNQLEEFKMLTVQSTGAGKKALALLGRTELFRQFMKRHSMLASMFVIPADASESTGVVNAPGLQTLNEVNALIQLRAGGPGGSGKAALTKNIRTAQSQLRKLKSNLVRGQDPSAEQSFDQRPLADSKTGSFLKRIEYGFNFQTQKANRFFPVATEFAVSAGYRVNRRSLAGLAFAYKMGWGKGWDEIAVTPQGGGFRSFVDWKIKGSIWISAAYELIDRQLFRSVNSLTANNSWNQSGLIGISKSISTNKKFLKKTKLQLLWNFLSYRQTPRTEPVIFRIGYSWN